MVQYYMDFCKQYRRRLQRMQKQFEGQDVDLGVEPL
jgi:hypothetical protein